MKIVVDRARCTGIGICESVAPHVFEVDDDGALVLMVEEAEDGDEAVTEAVRTCPAMALAMVDSSGTILP